MATVFRPPLETDIEYPCSDGRPMGETPFHVRNLSNALFTLDVWFGNDPNVYVAGNMFVYYERGDRHKHLSPDVFVVHGVPKTPERPCYLVWQEGKGPDCAIEFTSASTKAEDLDDKFELYRDVLKVREYFLFDPEEEYLEPSLQGFRLVDDQYVRIEAVDGRLPSEVLGLHLERDGWRLRFYDTAKKKWLPTIWEEMEARQEAEAARQRAEAENERLRRELEALRQQMPERR